LAFDEVNDLLYASSTDFFSYGRVYIYDSNTDEVSNFNVGISPGTIVFDVRTSVGVNELQTSFDVYPNPTTSELNISSNLEGKVIVSNYLGQEILVTKSKQLNLSGLSAGTYTISFNGSVQKILKL